MWIPILAGLFSGVVSGMGIGGGAILIPVLTILLHTNQHVAQCANLYYFIPTALAALAVHIMNNSVDFIIAWPIICFGLIGAAGGSLIAVYVSTGLLKKLFAVFLFVMGLQQFFGKPKQKT